VAEPAVDPDATVDKLDDEVRAELRSLPKQRAERVAGHLVMAGRLLDSDPELAYAHARVAQRLAARLAGTREAAGLAAYLSGHYSEALAELRAARRMTGSNAHWAVMADCERGLGRPERALAMASAPEAAELDHATRVELRIVAAGARRDQENPDAALVLLQGADLDDPAVRPWSARLRYAYADILTELGREDEARHWFAQAAYADADGTTDAAERLAELDGITFVDALDSDADDDDDPSAPDAAMTAEDEKPNDAVFDDVDDDGDVASDEAPVAADVHEDDQADVQADADIEDVDVNDSDD
jgi:tetratricopeptide (TPR) repeat protein